MGVLDDAIRDHLDLQRRRGADPAEIERAERDALGPVRRGPEPVVDEAPVGDGPPYDDEDEAALPPFDNAPAGELDDDELWADELEPEWEDEAAEAHPPLAVEPPPEASEAPAAPPGPARSPAIPEPRPASAGDETVEYRVEDALGHEGRGATEGNGEDVLEETPEFLQDTPDHDRLWFEQRPPRDFDFDG